MNRLRRSPNLILVIVLLFALVLRLTGVNWDDYARLHPDERFLTTIASRIGVARNLTDEARARCPDDTMLYDYFNTSCSILNPNNVNPGSFAYGTLPVFIVRGVADLLAKVNPWSWERPELWSSYDAVHLVGRMVNALADVITALFIYLIGRRLFSAWQGVLAAALYAFAVFPIQQAHFWTVDTLSHLFFVIGLYAAVEVSRTGRFWPYPLFGVALGAALASRINLFPMAALLPMASLINFVLYDKAARTRWRQWLVTEALLMLFVGVLGAVVFRIGQPYAFAGPGFTDWGFNPKWLADIEDVSTKSRLPTDGWPPSVQWFDRISYVFPWYNMAAWGMGVFLGAAATLAFALAVFQQLRLRRFSSRFTLLTIWIVVYFAFTGGLHQMTMRYYLPLYGALCLLAAWWLLSLSVSARRWAVAVVTGATLLYAVAFVTSIYTQPVTRIAASQWIVENYPATITFEDANGAQNYATLPGLSDASPYQLQTAWNGESYIDAEPFEVSSARRVRGLELTFSDTQPTRVRVEVYRDGALDTPLYIWDLSTDTQGHLSIMADELAALEAGSYRWHILSQWDGGRELRYFMPSSLVEEGGRLTAVPVRFASPYQTVPYFRVSAEEPLTFNLQSEVTVSSVLIPHTLSAPNRIQVRADNTDVTAALQLTTGENSLLGPQRRYTLEQPVTLRPGMALALVSAEPMYITGTGIATEGAWEDSLPSRYCAYEPNSGVWASIIRFPFECRDVNAIARGWYSHLALNMAETDTESKHRRMVDILQKADILTISSNRFYDALPRVKRRFAMSSDYYDRLFGGNLDYTMLKEFSRFPTIFGVGFQDQYLPTSTLPHWLNEYEAEEAFTVYDHPTAYVFRNDGFTGIDLPADFATLEVASAPIRTLDLAALPPPTFKLAGTPSTDSDVVRTLLLWSVGFLALGWLSYPLMFALFPSLPLRGFAIGRAVVWLALALVSWWLSAVAGTVFWTQAALWLMVALYAALNLWLAYRRRDELRAYVRENWRALLLAEFLFAAAFALGVVLRSVNPDLWHPTRGGEKPMDFAYLNAVLRASVFPPPNPWLSGYPINYYYFGFVIAALPIKLGGFAPEIGVNLVLGTLYAVVFMNVFVLAYSLLPTINRTLRGLLALVGVLFVMVAGNLGTIKLILDPEPNLAPNRWYWYPTRILGESANRAGGAINEMPVFSFLFGDLHAHIIGLLPVTVYLIILWLLVKRRRLWYGLPLGVVAGLIYMTNSWDVLMYVPLGALAMALAARSIRRFILLGLLVVIGGMITIAPYFARNVLGEAYGIQLWDGERSLIGPFLLTWGIPIGMAVLWLLYRIKALLPRSDKPVELGIVCIAGLALILLPPTAATSVLLLALVIVGLALAYRDNPDYRFAHLGLSLIFGGLLVIEYIVVRGDVGRMNTVFKTSFQLWLWVGLLMPVVLCHMLQNRYYVQTALCLALLALGLLFPIKAIPARLDDNPRRDITLDGDRFMAGLTIDNHGQIVTAAGDADLMRFMRTELDGNPVIAEWYEVEYNWNSRLSVQTGLPSVIGWRNHMRQQYTTLYPIIDQRIADINSLYTSGSLDEMRRVINAYSVNYIVLGELERSVTPPQALAAFETLRQTGGLTLVYDQGNTQLYRVNSASLQASR